MSKFVAVDSADLGTEHRSGLLATEQRVSQVLLLAGHKDVGGRRNYGEVI